MKNLETQISSFFKKFDNAEAVYIFGSYAKGKNKRSSDVDVAVLFDRDSTPDVLSTLKLKQELSSKTGKDIDLVVLNRANPILKMQVIRYGRKIFERSTKPLIYFIMRLATEYADLKKVRRPMEKNMLKRRIYGR